MIGSPWPGWGLRNARATHACSPSWRGRCATCRRSMKRREAGNPKKQTMTTLRPATSTIYDESLLKSLSRLSPELLMQFLTTLDETFIDVFNHIWGLFGLEHQKAPADDWTTWLLLGGRGAGKTRAGAEWVKALVEAYGVKASPIALIGETEHDAREVMVEGVSGLLAVHEHSERPTWIPSRRRLQWHNGAVTQVFSAENPESLRGPQFAAAWCDELAKWRHAEATFDMLQFRLRTV